MRRTNPSLGVVACATVGLTALLFSGCTNEPMSDTASPSAQVGTVARVDVPAVTIDLPAEPRPWDNSDEALVEAVRAANGLVSITFKEPGSPRALVTGRREAVGRASLQAGTALVTGLGGEILHELRFIGAVLARIDPAAASALRANPLVDFVEPNQRYEVHHVLYEGDAPQVLGRATGAPGAPGSTEYWDWGVWYMDAGSAWAYSTGVGAKYMHISTGHEQGHPDLPFVPTNNCGGTYGGCDDGPYGNYPGTNYLGQAVERWNGIGWVGVAPGVAGTDTYSWGACEVTGPSSSTCYTGQVAAGLDAARLVGAKVAFLGTYYSFYDATVATAVANAWQYGDIVMVAPAGNVPDGVPGQPQYPAAHDHVLGVSGIKPDYSFAGSGTCLAGFGSQYGSHVDVTAAFWSTATWGGGGYNVICTTNVGAGLVAGVAALMRAYRPGDDADAVIRGIKNSASALGDPQYFGAGLPNALKAVRDPPPPPSPITASISGPRSVKPNVYCTWFASASGGHPPYTYTWYKNSGYAGTGSEIQLHTGTSSFYLKVTATDAWNERGNQEIYVTVTSSARVCFT